MQNPKIKIHITTENYEVVNSLVAFEMVYFFII